MTTSHDTQALEEELKENDTNDDGNQKTSTTTTTPPPSTSPSNTKIEHGDNNSTTTESYETQNKSSDNSESEQAPNHQQTYQPKRYNNDKRQQQTQYYRNARSSMKNTFIKYPNQHQLFDHRFYGGIFHNTSHHHHNANTTANSVAPTNANVLIPTIQLAQFLKQQTHFYTNNKHHNQYNHNKVTPTQQQQQQMPGLHSPSDVSANDDIGSINDVNNNQLQDSMNYNNNNNNSYRYCNNNSNNLHTSKTNLYIRGLNPDTTDEDLHEMCKSYGEIKSTKAIIDKATLKCKGYGFVDYHSPDDALNALRELKKLDKDVQLAKQREQDPTNLYFANLPASVDEKSLTEMLQKKFQVNVNSTRIMRERNGESKCVGFARIDENKVCEQIIQDLNNKPFPSGHGLTGSDINKLLLVKLADSGGANGTGTNANSVHNSTMNSGKRQWYGVQQQQQQQRNLTFGSSSSGGSHHGHQQHHQMNGHHNGTPTSANCSLLSNHSTSTTNGMLNGSVTPNTTNSNPHSYQQPYANYSGFPIQMMDPTQHLHMPPHHPNHLFNHRNMMPGSHGFNGQLQVIPSQFFYIPAALTPHQHHMQHMQHQQQQQQPAQTTVTNNSSETQNGSAPSATTSASTTTTSSSCVQTPVGSVGGSSITPSTPQQMYQMQQQFGGLSLVPPQPSPAHLLTPHNQHPQYVPHHILVANTNQMQQQQQGSNEVCSGIEDKASDF